MALKIYISTLLSSTITKDWLWINKSAGAYKDSKAKKLQVPRYRKLQANRRGRLKAVMMNYFDYIFAIKFYYLL